MKTKSIISVIFVFVAIYIYISMYSIYESNSYNELLNYGECVNEKYIHRVIMDTGSNSYDNVYEKVKENADRYGVNICASKIKNKKNRKEISKYIYIADFSFFKNIKVEKGTFFDSSNIESEYFLSTENYDEDYQIGSILSFSPDTILNFKTLKSGLKNNVFKMNISLAADQKKYTDFINSLKSEGIVCYETAEKTKNIQMNSSVVNLILIIAVIVIVLIIIYDLFNSYKEIAIKKMLGYSYMSLCMEKLKDILLCQICFSLIVFCALKKVFNVRSSVLADEFYFSVLKLYFIIIVASAISVFLVYLLSRMFSISELIKNNNQNIKIIMINMLFKTIVCTIAVYFAFNTYLDLNQISKLYEDKYDKWMECRDYYCVSGLSTKYEDTDINSEEILMASYNVYKQLNGYGAVLCDFVSYDNDEKNFYMKEYGKNQAFMYLSHNINPNYLKVNQIFDASGNLVSISEECSNITYLVPEKYKEYEKSIYEFIRYMHDKNNNEDIDVIWIMNNQRVFTYNWYIDSENGCFIEDPVLCVYTLNNTPYSDFWYFTGAKDGPVKLKCINNDQVRNFYEILYQYFDEQIYKYNVYNYYDSVSVEIEMVNFKLKNDLIITLCLVIIIVLLIMQNIFIYFIEFEKETAVYTIMGYGFFKIHSLFFIEYGLVSGASFIVDLLLLHSVMAAKFMIIFFGIEFIITCILINCYSKNNILKMLKK